MITTAAAEHGVPEALLHRIIKRESNYNARAYHGGHWGLMQIKYETARSMGYRGPAAGLLNPETNLRFGGRYLAGAYLVANRNSERAVRLYSSGYYYEAKRKGLLEATRLKAGEKPVSGTAHVVLAHPEPRSYNAHLARLAADTLAAQGWSVTFSDLYDGLRPVRAGRAL